MREQIPNSCILQQNDEIFLQEKGIPPGRGKLSQMSYNESLYHIIPMKATPSNNVSIVYVKLGVSIASKTFAFIGNTEETRLKSDSPFKILFRNFRELEKAFRKKKSITWPTRRKNLGWGIRAKPHPLYRVPALRSIVLCMRSSFMSVSNFRLWVCRKLFQFPINAVWDPIAFH